MRSIFDREIARAEDDYETSQHVAWLGALRDEVLAAIAGPTSEPRAPGRRKTTTERGLGWDHQQVREGLLRAHIDGSPCWWCDRPMYHDRTRNWDYDPTSADPASGSLAADHTVSRSTGRGTKADRLMHERCNKQRQAGARDDQRPAATQAGSAPTKPRRAMAWPA